MTRTQLFEQIKLKKTFLCVGLDTDIKKIPEHLQSLPAQDAIFEFNKAIIDATEPYCIAYKPNLAFYECFGVEGWIAFEKTVRYIREKYPNQFIIADAPDSFLLVPGIGAQGGSLQEVVRYGMNKQCGLIVNSSRAIIYADHTERFAEVAAQKAKEVADEMAECLKPLL